MTIYYKIVNANLKLKYITIKYALCWSLFFLISFLHDLEVWTLYFFLEHFHVSSLMKCSIDFMDKNYGYVLCITNI